MRASEMFQRRLAARVLAVVGAAWLAVPTSACKTSGGSNGAGGHRTGGHTTGTGGAPRDGGATSSSSSGAGGAIGDAGPTDGAADGAPHDGSFADGASQDGAPDDGAAGSGGAAGTGGSANPASKLCFPWPQVILDAGTGGASADDAGEDAGPCPTDKAAVLAVFQASGCPRGFEPGTILSGPLMPPTPAECCYETLLTVCGPGGRPYLEAGVAVRSRVELAATDAGARWCAEDRPRVFDLDAPRRAALASAWAEDAVREHASVASFARAALALMAVGAPADLVARTHEAAIDEVRHARACFALASTYAGRELGPGPFPLGATVPVPASLTAIAASAAAEGCVGETVAASLAAEQLEHATDPAVRAALAVIVEDEARHAELAWATVAWSIRAGGDEVRSAVLGVLADAVAEAARGRGACGERRAAQSDLTAHGRLDVATVRRVAAEAILAIVAPGARALRTAARPMAQATPVV